MNSFYEFFSGGGMARAGLGADWECLFANDIDEKKAASYAANWGNDALCVRDVAELKVSVLPGQADLAWASFPCQDLSAAGSRAGLSGDRSGTFWPFWHLVKELGNDGRPPRLIVLENVCGALRSHDGKDFATIGGAMAAAGYRFGALVINASHFLPQSRPRLFIVGAHKSFVKPATLSDKEPDERWHPPALLEAHSKLSQRARRAWVWWKLPEAPGRTSVLADVIEDEPQGVRWDPAEKTQRLLRMMTPLNRAKVSDARKSGQRAVGTIYRRTRVEGQTGRKVQRAEIRFDDMAGCLRTPVGGSSRQTIMVIDGRRVRSRLLSPREAARLMGLPDDYILPTNYNEAYHLAGDGVAVDVVRFLAAHLLEPLAAERRPAKKQAA